MNIKHYQSLRLLHFRVFRLEKKSHRSHSFRNNNTQGEEREKGKKREEKSRSRLLIPPFDINLI